MLPGVVLVLTLPRFMPSTLFCLRIRDNDLALPCSTALLSRFRVEARLSKGRVMTTKLVAREIHVFVVLQSDWSRTFLCGGSQHEMCAMVTRPSLRQMGGAWGRG